MLPALLLALLAPLPFPVRAKVETREQYFASDNQMEKLRFLSNVISRNASATPLDEVREVEFWGL
jgi:hypothetical protein